MTAPQFDVAMTQLAEGVWSSSGQVRHLGLHLTATMTALRLDDGALLLHSPIALTPELRAAVERLGPVAHLYAPNVYHHRWIGAWAQAFPDARVHAPPGLATKRPDLRIDRVHGAPGLPAGVDELPIAGFLLEESALYHRASRTLVVADLVHNIGRPEHGWTRLYARAMGFYDRVALSRMIRWAAFPDRAAARRSLDAVLALPFERVVVGHGAPVSSDARAAVAAAYAWLPAR